MRANGLVLRKRKTKKTTNSRHHFRKFENLIVGFEPTKSNQLWVSDITYLETVDDTCYLSLITDAYSHKIVGWAVGETLEAIHPITALEIALEDLNGNIPKGLIHHSDGCAVLLPPVRGNLAEERHLHQHDSERRST
jgi:transposase InsO family protein